MYPVIILAGGKATRIKKITKNNPKSLLKINKKPFIDYQLEYFKKNGIKKIILCLGHQGEIIKDYIEKKNYKEFKFIYSFDGKYPLGTGGAVKKAIITKDKYFFIVYGDSFLRLNLKNIKRKFEKSNKSVLMTLIKNDNNWDKSNVEIKNKIIVSYNKFKQSKKMKYIDYGLSIISKKSIINFNKNEFDLADFFSIISEKGMIIPYIAKKRFFEIGSFKGIKDFKKHISLKSI